MYFGNSFTARDNKGEAVEIMHCCHCPGQVNLCIGDEWRIFCPSCRRYNGAGLPKWVMCCNDCQKPLAVSPVIMGGEVKYGSYCLNCGFAPSMQDKCFNNHPSLVG